MPDDFHFDMSEFRAAFDEIAKSGKRTAAQIINRAGLLSIAGGKGVAGAIKLTPRASKGAIAGLDIKKIKGFIVRKARLKGQWPLTNKQIEQRARFERQRRIRAIAYTAGPGWGKALLAFGGRGLNAQPGFKKSLAARGYGVKATASKLAAELANTAPAADAIGREALQQALDNAARDMVEFHRKKMGETLAKNSAK